MKIYKPLRTACIVTMIATCTVPTGLALAVTAPAPKPSTVTIQKPDVFITEIQTATKASAGEEFIELFNDTDQDIDFADAAHDKRAIWKLQYFSSSKVAADGAVDWSKPSGAIDLSAMQNTVIGAHDYYLLATSKSDGTAYQPGGTESDGRYSAKFSDTAAVQLVDTVSVTAVTTIHDRLTWQATPQNEAVYTAPEAGKSLQRKTNEDLEYTNDDTSNLLPFLADQPTPKNAWQPTLPDQEENNGLPEGTPNQNKHLLDLKMTELLPNPATPQTDADDEYIELYNPNDSDYDLYAMSLETGSTTLHDFSFAEHIMVPARSYQVFYSRDTQLALSNSGGQVRLLSATKQVMDQSMTYTAAPDGQSWALVHNVWQWTTPTPGMENTAVVPVSATPATTTKSAKVKGVSTVRKPAKVKSASSKKQSIKKAKKAKAKKKVKLVQPIGHLAAAVKPAPIHAWVLAAVGGAAVLYALYEYRVDLANHYYKLRRNRSDRRSDRRAFKRKRND